MKVPASIRRLFEDQLEPNGRLKGFVDARLTNLKKARWHYESRLKELQSFALKLETGRVKNATALEDFFASTIVVANIAEVEEAERLIMGQFHFHERRPVDRAITPNASDSFLFADLRLYVSLRPNDNPPNPVDLIGVIFEVQVKTFLQHAWSIATHDLIYKSDDVEWSKERIAYQIKAMLEHAEVSIQEAENLANSACLGMQDNRTKAVRDAISLLKREWTEADLPRDVRRLADTISNLIRELGIEVDDLGRILDAGKAARAGSHPANLSPYATVVQYLLEQKRDSMISLMRRTDRRKARIVLPSEVELPVDLDRATLRNVMFIDAA